MSTVPAIGAGCSCSGLLWPQEVVWWSPEEVNQYESQHHGQQRPQYACHRLEEKGYNNLFCKDSIFYTLFSALNISSAMTSFSDRRWLRQMLWATWSAREWLYWTVQCWTVLTVHSTAHYRGRSQLNTMSSASFWCAGDLYRVSHKKGSFSLEGCNFMKYWSIYTSKDSFG